MLDGFGPSGLGVLPDGGKGGRGAIGWGVTVQIVVDGSDTPRHCGLRGESVTLGSPILRRRSNTGFASNLGNGHDRVFGCSGSFGGDDRHGHCRQVRHHNPSSRGRLWFPPKPDRHRSSGCRIVESTATITAGRTHDADVVDDLIRELDAASAQGSTTRRAGEGLYHSTPGGPGDRAAQHEHGWPCRKIA